MPIAHAMAGGMGGVRTAGDLVARMQMRRMRLADAKRYVAKRLGVDVAYLTDEFTMRRVREELGIGFITAGDHPGGPRYIEAKVRIAELLGIKINCVEILYNRIRKA